MVIHIMKSLLQPQFQKVLALFLLSLVHVIGISDSLIFLLLISMLSWKKKFTCILQKVWETLMDKIAFGFF